MSVLEIIHRAIEILPVLAKFAVFMVLVISMPRLSRRVRLPDAVGLLLSGVLLGPHVLDVFSRQHLVAEFFSELGMLLPMFFAGLEIILTLFREKIFRSIVFGVVTTSVPLLLGTLVAHWLGYALLPATVVGSLLASHTLLASNIVAKLGVNRLEPIVVTFGATMMSDTLSLLVFAVCVPLYTTGFSASGLAIQVIEIILVRSARIVRARPRGCLPVEAGGERRGELFHLDAGYARADGAACPGHQSAGYCGSIHGRLGGQCGGGGQAGHGQAQIHRKYALHPELLHRDGLFDRPAGAGTQPHGRLLPGGGNHRCARCG